jgi:hypothetical protein
MRTTFRASLAVIFVFAAVTSARAESQPKTHDGFHFQLAGGLGFYSVSGAAPANQDFSGMTFPGSLLIGGTLFGHMAFGAGMILDYAPGPTYEWNGTEVTDTISSQMIMGFGLYGDYYLDAQKNGLHLQVFGGWGGLETSFQGNVGGSDPTGLVASAGLGYEWWLTEEWSGGLMARVVYAPLDLNGTAFKTFEPAVVGTLTWH